MSENADVEYVQPILVSAAGAHEDTVLAAARAAVRLWQDDQTDPSWGTWLSGPFTKTVRRVKPARLERFLADTDTVHAVERQDTTASIAVALRPSPLSAFPTEAARAQVQGTDFPRTRWDDLPDDWDTTSSLLLVINPDLDEVMTTGKTAAQAAHALMGLAVSGVDVNVDEARIVRAVNRDVFADVVRTARVVISDAGRTEIAPGSVTFAAL